MSKTRFSRYVFVEEKFSNKCSIINVREDEKVDQSIEAETGFIGYGNAAMI